MPSLGRSSKADIWEAYKGYCAFLALEYGTARAKLLAIGDSTS